MAYKTQLRLQQITGSLVNLKTEAQQYVTPAAASALTGSDLQDVLGAMAASLNRMHGAASSEPFNNTAGVFRSATNSAAALKLHADAGTSQTIQLLNDEGTSSSAIDLTATAGGFSVDGVQASNITVASAGGADDLTISVTGATDSSLILSSAGTAADALQITATAGGIDISASGAAAGEDIDITATGSSVNISSTEADGAAITINASGNGGIDISAGASANDAAANIDFVAMNKLTIDAQGTDSGDGVEITLGADTAAVGLKVKNNSGTDMHILDAAGDYELARDLIVGRNLVVEGNLDINGTTTTVDSVNLSIQDSIIALGVSGSDGGYSTTGDRGILFPRGTDSSATNALWYDGTQFNLAVSKTGPTSGSFASIDSYSDLHVGDVVVKQDAGTLKFGADAEVTLTHVHNAGLLLNSAMKLQFGDAGTYVHQASNGELHFVADVLAMIQAPESIIEASTAIQMNSPIIDFEDDAVVLQFGANDDVTLTHVHDTGLLLNGAMQIQLGDAATHIKQVSDSNLEIEADGSIILDSPVVDFQDDGVIAKFGDDSEVTLTHVHDAGLLLNSAMQLQFGDSGTYVHQSTNGQLDAIADVKAMITAPVTEIQSSTSIQLDTPIVDFEDNGAILQFGAADAVTLTHIADTALRLNSTMKLEFNDAKVAVSKAGTDQLALRSNNVQWLWPSADGSADQVLGTDAAGNLSFIDASAGTKKFIGVLTGSHVAGINFRVDSNGNKVGDADAISNLATAGTQGKSLDVFVNGQLLVSGSVAERVAGTRDYVISNATNIAFAFDLESDDIVQVVKR
jgi:hypothetical protein